MQYVHDRRMQLDKVSGDLLRLHSVIFLCEMSASKLASTLDAISPLKVLGRGYAIATDDRGAVVKSADDVSTGTSLNIFLGKGSLSCTVTSVDPTYSLENRIADRITEDTSEHNSSIDQIKTTEDVDSAAPNQLKLDI